MPPFACWITRAQALALLGLAVAVVVLAVTSTTTLAAGFVVSEVAAALLGALLLAVAPLYRRVRTPILLLEIIAVGVAVQLGSVDRLPVALLVGVPALAAVVGILLGARGEP